MFEKTVNESSTVLLGLTGSRAYGTDVDNSDTDYRGVYIPSEEYYFGLSKPKEYTSGSDNVDMFLSTMKRFVSRCVSGSPSDLELLFLRESDYVHMTDIGRELINHRHLFLSKYARYRFGGYASTQKKQMLTGARVDENHGYDTKGFMHSVRMYQMGIDLLRYGTFSVYRENRETLKELRAGKFTLKEAVTYLEGLEMELDYYHAKSTLPETVDTEPVNALLVRLTKTHLGF